VEFELELRAAIYRYFVDWAKAPTIDAMAHAVGRSRFEVAEGFQRLAERRMLVLMPDDESIRMALPFSGVETQHEVRARGKTYFANCPWDSFGIPAALHADADVLSRCEQTHEPLSLHLASEDPLPSGWVFHAAVPASHWWRDIVYT
jgi:hypothetical protein